MQVRLVFSSGVFVEVAATLLSDSNNNDRKAVVTPEALMNAIELACVDEGVRLQVIRAVGHAKT